MEKRLTQILDFHRFAPNAKLAEMLREMEADAPQMLEDDELEMLNAAGDWFDDMSEEDDEEDK